MRLTSLKLESVEDLFLEELRDLYDAENQLLKALPKMAEAATTPALKMVFSQHLEETKGHVGRLDRVFRKLDANPSGETCEAMKGLVKEGEQFVQAKGEPSVRDAGLIGQRNGLSTTRWPAMEPPAAWPNVSATKRSRPYSNRHWKRKAKQTGNSRQWRRTR